MERPPVGRRESIAVAHFVVADATEKLARALVADRPRVTATGSTWHTGGAAHPAPTDGRVNNRALFRRMVGVRFIALGPFFGRFLSRRGRPFVMVDLTSCKLCLLTKLLDQHGRELLNQKFPILRAQRRHDNLLSKLYVMGHSRRAA